MATNLVTDNFTDANGTAITAHTADTGDTWTLNSTMSGTNAPTVQTNKLTGTSGNFRIFYPSSTPSGANYDVTAVMYLLTMANPGDNGHGMIIGGRYSTSAQTGYQVTYQGSNGNIIVELGKVIATAFTSLGTYTITAPAAGSSNTIKLQMRGTSLTVFVDGVSRITATDSAISAVGKPIVGSNGSNVSQGPQVDSFSVDLPTTDASLTVPMLTISAGNIGAALAIPMFTLSAHDGATAASVSIPMFTLVATGKAGTVSTASVAVPMFSMSANEQTGTYALLAFPALTAAGNVSNALTAAIRFPSITAIGTAIGSPLITANITIPVFQVIAYGANTAELELSMFSVTGTTLVGSVSTFDQILPMFSVLAMGYGKAIIDGLISLPAIRVTGSVVIGSINQSQIIIPGFQLLGSGFSGNTAVAVLNIPVLSVSAAAHGPLTATAALVLPMFYMDAVYSQAVDTVFRTWVLNIRKAALTEYDNFAFNSTTNFKGKILAAGPGGIFQLATQNTDNAANINATVLTGQNDFGSSTLKRIPRIYVGYKSSGDMEFHTITSQDGTRKYLLSTNACLGLQQRRVPIGRGPKSRYWQFGLVNRDGTDFLIESLLVYPEQTHRRNI